MSARLKRTPLFIGLLAAFLAGAVIAPPLIAWLVTSFVELTGGERQNRPAVTQQDLLKLRGASDAQSEIELRSMHGRLMERTKAEYDKYLAGERRKTANHKCSGYFKWWRLRRLRSRGPQRVAEDLASAPSR